MSEVKEVLHIINGEFYAGAERVQDLLALRLPEFGYRVTFSCLKDGIFGRSRMARNAAVHVCPMRSRLDIGAALSISRIVRSRGYPLLHTHTPRAALIGRVVGSLTGRPMIHHVHSPTISDTETGWRNMRNDLSERVALTGVRRLIPVSKGLEGMLLRRGFDSARISTVFNGVPMQKVLRGPRRVGEPLVLGMVALFRPRKGTEVLLQALGLLRRRGHDVRLRAVGPFETREYGEALRILTRDLGLSGHVAWHGFAADVSAEYAKMHLFVLPSLYGEGMPMVLLEAMAVGLPVIASRIEGIPEVVRNGRDGLLVEPDDAEALAEAIRRFACNEVDGAMLGDSGRHRQRALFSDIAMARRLAEIYDEMMAA